MEASMGENFEFMNDYLVHEYGVHKEADTPFSSDIDDFSDLMDDEFHSPNDELLELSF